MEKYIFSLELGQKLINGEIVKVLDSYRTTFGPLEEICGYDVVEIAVNKGVMPLFQKGNKKYVGCKVEHDSFVSVLCPIN